MDRSMLMTSLYDEGDDVDKYDDDGSDGVSRSTD